MNIREISKKFLNGEGTITELSKVYKCSKKDLKADLESMGYVIKKGYRLSTIIGLKLGVEEYIANIDNKPSLSKICAKYNMNRKTLSDRLKELGYEVINYQNQLRFNENIFDTIDTEEKAYWLGFIFADGYISSSNYLFELSLSIKDVEHLNKFNSFMQHCDNNVKINDSNNYGRCRWAVHNRHLWETLNSYGCTPKKSLTLQFPKTSIFASNFLIKHFIRGYFDGDGCISYSTKDHKSMAISLLGTEDFLTGVKENLPCKYNYVLGYNNKSLSLITRVLSINGKNGLEILHYLYHNSNCFLNRKFEKYKEYCRLYKELYRLLESKNGEGCNANPVITEEIKDSSVLYSVEGETL